MTTYSFNSIVKKKHYHFTIKKREKFFRYLFIVLFKCISNICQKKKVNALFSSLFHIYLRF